MKYFGLELRYESIMKDIGLTQEPQILEHFSSYFLSLLRWQSSPEKIYSCVVIIIAIFLQGMKERRKILTDTSDAGSSPQDFFI